MKDAGEFGTGGFGTDEVSSARFGTAWVGTAGFGTGFSTAGFGTGFSTAGFGTAWAGTATHRTARVTKARVVRRRLGEGDNTAGV